MATQVSAMGGKTIGQSSFDELTSMAQRVQTFTNASGAAIGLRIGDTEDIVCCARSGPSARDVSTIMGVAGSFAGLCIQSGKGLLCDDTEADPRLDANAVRSLGVRSIAVTPIKEDNRVVGVLAVLSPFANAFTGIHLAVVKTTADQISALLQRERRARDEGQEPAAQWSPAPVHANKPPVSSAGQQAAPAVIHPDTAAVPAASIGFASPAPAVAKPQVTAMPVASAVPASSAPMPVKKAVPIAAVAAPAPVTASPVLTKTATPAAPTHAEFATTPKTQPLAAIALAEDVAPAISLPAREDRHWRPKHDHASVGVLDSSAEPKKKSHTGLVLMGLAAVVLIGLGSTFAVRKWNRAEPPEALQHPQEAPNTLAVQTPPVQNASNTQPASSGGIPPSTTSAGNTNNAQPSAAPVVPSANSAAPNSTVKNSSVDTARKSDKTQTQPQTQAQTQAKPNGPSPAEKPAVETVALAAGPSRIVPATAADSAPQDTNATPALTIAVGPALGKLTALPSASAPSKPSAMSQSVEPIQVLKRVSPLYPSMAKARGIKGDIVVRAHVGKDGHVSNLEMVSGIPIFRDAAFEAVKQWQFKPAMVNGQAVDQDEVIRFDFK
jgi:TonB family protein